MRINHVALYCLDLEGMKDFFIRYFKGVPNELYHNPRTALKTYILSFEDSDAKLELMTRPEVKDEQENVFRQGFIHLSFSVGSKETVDCLTNDLNRDGYKSLHTGTPRYPESTTIASSESTFYLGARTLQITQFINLPRLNNPTLIRLAVVPFRVDPVEIPFKLGIDMLM